MDTTPNPDATEELVVSLTKSERIWAVSNRVNLISLILLGLFFLTTATCQFFGVPESEISRIGLSVFLSLGYVWLGSACVSGFAGAFHVLFNQTAHNPREGSKWVIALLLLAWSPVTIYYYRKRI